MSWWFWSWSRSLKLHLPLRELQRGSGSITPTRMNPRLHPKGLIDMSLLVGLVRYNGGHHHVASRHPSGSNTTIKKVFRPKLSKKKTDG